MMWLLWIGSALASTNAGMGLSPLGGGFDGVSESGVLGLGLNPAAAKSEGIEAPSTQDSRSIASGWASMVLST